MSRFFVHIYTYLSEKKWLRNTLMFGSFLLMLFFAFQLKLEEEFTRFFPDNKDSANSELVFKNLKIKDKIIVMVSGCDTLHNDESLDKLVKAGVELAEQIKQSEATDYITDVFSEVGGETISQISDFIYQHLPVFLTENDYRHLDTLLTAEAIDKRMQHNFINLMSPAGIALKSTIQQDPLGLAGNVMLSLKDFENLSNYEITTIIFSSDFSTMLIILSPKYGTGETGKNEVLISNLEQLSKNIEEFHPGIQVQFLAVHQWRFIMQDK